MPVELTARERELLAQGLVQWVGPARMTDQVAAVIGFLDATGFRSEVQRLVGEVEGGDELSPSDARRALVATEIVFASDVVGAGVEWETVTGMSDADTLRLLRGLQLKLIRISTSADDG